VRESSVIECDKYSVLAPTNLDNLLVSLLLIVELGYRQTIGPLLLV
jgi:hypothetical protein